MAADSLDDDDLVIRGEIETSSVPELLRSFLASQETGILTFRHGEDTKTLYIMGGRVVWAASNDPDERLGEDLLVRGKISARQYVEASKGIRPGRRLGAILVEMEALEPEELIPAVEHQIRGILNDLFSWARGEYEFRFKELDPDSMVTVSLPTEGLILDGIRSSRSWAQVIRGLGNIEAVFAPTGNTDVLYKLELSEEEQEILSRVNGSFTVEQICDVSYLSNFETCRILWALSVLGVIRRSQGDDQQRAGEQTAAQQTELDLEGIVEKFNQMFARVYGFLKGRIGGEGVDAFMDGVLEEGGRQYAALFEGVDLKHYGRADYEQMLANVADLPAEQRRRVMVSGLNELVGVMQLRVQQRQVPQEEAVVSGIIKDGLRRLGAG